MPDFVQVTIDDGVAVLLSTHDPSIVIRADRVLELHDGVLKPAQEPAAVS